MTEPPHVPPYEWYKQLREGMPQGNPADHPHTEQHPIIDVQPVNVRTESPLDRTQQLPVIRDDFLADVMTTDVLPTVRRERTPHGRHRAAVIGGLAATAVLVGGGAAFVATHKSHDNGKAAVAALPTAPESTYSSPDFPAGNPTFPESDTPTVSPSATATTSANKPKPSPTLQTKPAPKPIPTSANTGATITVLPAPPVVVSSPEATPTDTTTVPAVSKPLWTGNYETSDHFSQFKNTPELYQPEEPTATRHHTADGNYAGRYEIPAGGTRCENVPNLPAVKEGDSLWYGWSTMLDSNFPLDTNDWQILAQWNNKDASVPALALAVKGGHYVLIGTGEANGTPGQVYGVDLGQAQTNSWDRWTAYINFSSEPSVGGVSLWHNGHQLLGNAHLPGGTLYQDLSAQLEIGYARDPDIDTTAAVYHDDWKVGPSSDTVAPTTND